MFLLLFHYRRVPTTGPGKEETERPNASRAIEAQKGDAHDGTAHRTQCREHTCNTCEFCPASCTATVLSMSGTK